MPEKNNAAVASFMDGATNPGAAPELFATPNLALLLRDSGVYFQAFIVAPEFREYEDVQSWWLDQVTSVAKYATKLAGTWIDPETVKELLQKGGEAETPITTAIESGMSAKFAQNFERYLLTGKAPEELQRAFLAFRSWMLFSYGEAKARRVAMSRDVVSLFERLIAVDAAISREQRHLGGSKTPFASATEVRAHGKLRQKAQDQTVTDLIMAVMTPLRFAKQKTFRAERQNELISAITALQAQPLYRAISEMRFGQGYDGVPVQRIKLSATDIARDYGLQVLAKLPGAAENGGAAEHAVYADDGVHPDVAAGLYGFESGQALLVALATAPSIDDAANMLADRIMAQRHGDPLVTGQLREAALDALHNDTAGEVLAFELKTLHEMIGTQGAMTLEGAKRRASELLAEMPVRDAIDIDAFLAAGKRTGEEAYKLVRGLPEADVEDAEAENADVAETPGGDEKAGAGTRAEKLEKAMLAKRRQLLNHALYNEGRKAQEQVKALLARVPARTTGEGEHIKAARAVAAHFGLAQASEDFDTGVWMDGLLADDPLTAEILKSALDVLMTDRRPFQDLTMTELTAAGDAIAAVLAIADPDRSIDLGRESAPRSAVAANMVLALQNVAPATLGALRQLERVDLMPLSMEAGQALLVPALQLIDGDADGVLHAALVRPVLAAQQHYDAARDDLMPKLHALIAARADLAGAAIAAPELGHVFANKGEVLHAMLHSGNPVSLEKLLVGRGWAGQGAPKPKRNAETADEPIDKTRWEALIGRLIATGILTQADFALVQEIWDVAEGLLPLLQEGYRRLYGHGFVAAKQNPIRTPFGLYRGGFVPAVKDAGAPGAEENRPQLRDAFLLPAVMPAIGKPKGDVVRPSPLALNLWQLSEHFDQALRFALIYPAVRQVASLIMSGDIYAGFAALDPTLLPERIMPFLQRAAQPDAVGEGATSATYARLRRQVGLSRLLRTLVQIGRAVKAVLPADIAPQRLRAALLAFTGGQDETMLRQASERSPAMRQRLAETGRAMSLIIDRTIQPPTALGGETGLGADYGAFIETGLSNLLSLVIWHGAYDEAVAAGADNSAAVMRADAAVVRLPERITLFDSAAFDRLFGLIYAWCNGQAQQSRGGMAGVMQMLGWPGEAPLFFPSLFGLAIPAIAAEMIGIDALAERFFGGQKAAEMADLPDLGLKNPAVLARFRAQFYGEQPLPETEMDLPVEPLPPVDAAAFEPPTLAP